MFVGQDLFYFATIRKLSAAFGSLFNNIYIQRFDQPGGQGNVVRSIRVPLTYAAGEKWYVHRTQDVPAQSSPQTRISLPRIGFELVDMQYNQSRKLNTLNYNTTTSESDVDAFLKQLEPVPYDFQYDVHIAVKNIDDALQIVEQVVPNFRPSFNLRVDDIPELSITKDVPVILNGISKTDDYEGAFDTKRIHIWTLSFVVKGYLYPPIGEAQIIKKVFGNIYKDEDLTSKSGVTTVRVNPIDSAFSDDWEEKTDKFDETQLDSNGDPIEDSNGDPIV